MELPPILACKEAIQTTKDVCQGVYTGICVAGPEIYDRLLKKAIDGLQESVCPVGSDEHLQRMAYAALELQAGLEALQPFIDEHLRSKSEEN